jgi:hypothetical protein
MERVVPMNLVQVEQALSGFYYGITGGALGFQFFFAAFLLLVVFRNNLKLLFGAD